MISRIDSDHACKLGYLWEHTAVRNDSCKRLDSTICFYYELDFITVAVGGRCQS